MSTLPNSLEAEQSVIGSILQEPELFDLVIDIITAEDFFKKENGELFGIVKHMSENNLPIDILTVSDRAIKLGVIDSLADVGEMVKNTPSTANVKDYARLVKDNSSKREMIRIASDIGSMVTEESTLSGTERLEIAEKKLSELADKEINQGDGLVPVRIILEKTLDKLDKICQMEDGEISGLSSGFRDLDGMTTGFHPGDLIICAARPAMGKTTFAVNICENIAMEDPKKPVVIFSLEMPADQLMMRMLASIGGVDQTKIRKGELNDEDWGMLSMAMGKISECNILIDDAPNLTPSDIRARVKRAEKEHGQIGIIMIDYLQLMRVPSLAANRVQEVSEISRSLKALAKDMNCPVLALAQLNRGLEQRVDKRPICSDLRESGSIEQDADLIMFIYRDEVYNEDSDDKGMAEIIIGKQRNGAIGKFRTLFNGSYSRFQDYQVPMSDYT